MGDAAYAADSIGSVGVMGGFNLFSGIERFKSIYLPMAHISTLFLRERETLIYKMHKKWYNF